MEVPLKLLGIVAFIMFATYFSAYIIFDDSTTAFEEYAKDERPTIDLFMTWLQETWPQLRVYAMERENWQTMIIQIDGSNRGVLKVLSIQDKRMRQMAVCTGVWLDEHYPTYPNDFREVYDDLPTSKQRCLRDFYNQYIRSSGFVLVIDDLTGEASVQAVKKNLFDLAIDFIWAIPDRLAEIADVLTFGFKDKYGEVAIPTMLRLIINIIFIPLWIVFAVGFLPLIARFISAIGNIIPF